MAEYCPFLPRDLPPVKARTMRGDQDRVLLGRSLNLRSAESTSCLKRMGDVSGSRKGSQRNFALYRDFGQETSDFVVVCVVLLVPLQLFIGNGTFYNVVRTFSISRVDKIWVCCLVPGQWSSRARDQGR